MMVYKEDFKAAITGFENGGRDWQDKECEQSLEGGKEKEMDSFLEPLERNASLETPWYGLMKPIRSMTYRTVTS